MADKQNNNNPKLIHFTAISSHNQCVAEDAPNFFMMNVRVTHVTCHWISRNFHELLVTSNGQDSVWKSPVFSCDVFLENLLSKQC